MVTECPKALFPISVQVCEHKEVLGMQKVLFSTFLCYNNRKVELDQTVSTVWKRYKEAFMYLYSTIISNR